MFPLLVYCQALLTLVHSYPAYMVLSSVWYVVWQGLDMTVSDRTVSRQAWLYRHTCCLGTLYVPSYCDTSLYASDHPRHNSQNTVQRVEFINIKWNSHWKTKKADRSLESIKCCVKQTFQCKFCRSSFTIKQNYQRHNRNVHFKEVQIDNQGNHTFTDKAVVPEDVTCSYCKNTFLCKNYLRKHIRTIHADIEKNKMVMEKQNKEKVLCTECDSSFVELQDYKRHCKTAHIAK